MIQGLTVFVPVLDEEAVLVPNLRRLLAHAQGLVPHVQLVVVDNGSTDGTPRLLAEEAAREPRLLPLRLPEPGVGAALAAALPHVAHEAVACVDADLSVDLTFLDGALHAMEQGADVVVGSKRSGVERRSPLRLAGSVAFSWCCRHLLDLPVDDASIGAKLWRTDVLRRHAAAIGRDSTYVLEILSRAHDEGRAVIAVPIACHDTRASRFNLLREGVLRFGHLFGLAARRAARALLGALRPLPTR